MFGIKQQTKFPYFLFHFSHVLLSLMMYILDSFFMVIFTFQVSCLSGYASTGYLFIYLHNSHVILCYIYFQQWHPFRSVVSRSFFFFSQNKEASDLTQGSRTRALVNQYNQPTQCLLLDYSISLMLSTKLWLSAPM